MHLLYGTTATLPANFLRGCALTIGNFDGVHLGHQVVLKHLKECATKLNLPACVMLFEPHPIEYFAQCQDFPSPARIMSLREKIIALNQFAIDAVLVMPFNAEFARCTAENFVNEILLKQLKVKFLSVGDDFHFGANRHGNFELLTKMASKGSFQVEKNPTFYINNQRVSSTNIRQLLQAGDFLAVKTLLGEDFSIINRVIYGNQLGRTIGSPTANLAINRQVSPLHGVFAVQAHLMDGRTFPAVANIGTRPSINGSKLLLETHLLNFNGDLYGQFLKVSFHHKIRSEQKFSSLDQLKTQIQRDIQSAKEFLG